jgi:tetratricopeptide (TPR) repeat protein
MHVLSRAIMLSVWAGLAGCGGAFAAAPPSPDQGGHPWLEVTTRRFVLHTDLDEQAARAAARSFEYAYAYLEQVAFPGYEGLSRPMDVVLFHDTGEFHHFWPSDMSGVYFDRAPQDLERSPTMVLYGGLEGDARIVFLHELTHRFIARAYGWAPAWMNEGLADYFSTMRIESGRVVLGMVPPGRLIEPSLIPTVRELAAADHAAFYGQWTGEDFDGVHRARFYAGAYALVHMFRNGPDDQRKRFDDFVDAMNGGARAADAWARTIGSVSEDELERAFRAHLSSWRSWDLFGGELDPLPPFPPEKVVPMREEDVHILWARVMLAGGGSPTDVRAQLNGAQAAAGPSSAAVSYAKGCLELPLGRTAEASALLDDALARSPDDPRYLFATLVVRARAGAQADGLRDSIERLTRIAKSSDELSAAAIFLSERGDHDAALRDADAAVTADPGYALALAARARVNFESGRYAEAVVDQEHAVAFVPEHVDNRALVQALEKYRAASATRSQANGSR